MPAPASVRIGPAEIALTRMADGAEIDREVAHRGLQRRLGHAHDVVVRHRPLAAIVGQRHHRAARRHQHRGALRHLGEREAGDQHGAQEIGARGVGVAALELVLVGERDRVHQEIERAPLLGDGRERGVDRRRVLDVARQQQVGIDGLRQRLDAAAERLALIGEGERRAVRGERLRNAPGDRVVVGDPHDQPALALHQPRHVHHTPHVLRATRLRGSRDRLVTHPAA